MRLKAQWQWESHNFHIFLQLDLVAHTMLAAKSISMLSKLKNINAAPQLFFFFFKDGPRFRRTSDKATANQLYIESTREISHLCFFLCVYVYYIHVIFLFYFWRVKNGFILSCYIQCDLLLNAYGEIMKINLPLKEGPAAVGTTVQYS